MTSGRDAPGGGIGGFGIAEEEVTPLGGTGGAAGPGTRAGKGEPSGEGILGPPERKGDAGSPERDEQVPSEDGPLVSSDPAKEAAALGSSGEHDRTPSLEYGEGDRPRGPTIGEALGSGAGSSTGSGTPAEDSIGTGQLAPSADDAKDSGAS